MTVTATDFKAKCLQLLERVKLTHEPVLITKRGKAIAQLTGRRWAKTMLFRTWNATGQKGSIL